MAKNNPKKKKKVKVHQNELGHVTMKQEKLKKTIDTTYETIHQEKQVEVKKLEWNYWQEAIVLSELLGVPACKRRRKRMYR